MKHYSGVGSRKTPSRWLAAMTRVARRLECLEFVLRSGGADGADAAFQAGVNDFKEIYIPWNGFNGLTEDGDYGVIAGTCHEAEEIARKIHPAWDRCSQGARKLHARNIYQVLGPDLVTPSEFLLCWTPGGADVGGTATAIRLARAYDVPVFNFGNPDDVAEFNTLLTELET